MTSDLDNIRQPISKKILIKEYDYNVNQTTIWRKICTNRHSIK